MGGRERHTVRAGEYCRIARLMGQLWPKFAFDPGDDPAPRPWESGPSPGRTARHWPSRCIASFLRSEASVSQAAHPARQRPRGPLLLVDPLLEAVYPSGQVYELQGRVTDNGTTPGHFIRIARRPARPQRRPTLLTAGIKAKRAICCHYRVPERWDALGPLIAPFPADKAPDRSPA